MTKDKCFVEYTALENEAVGGLFDSVCAGYYYARPMGEDTVYVKEIYLANDNFPHIAAALLRRFPTAKQFVFDFCPGTVPAGFDYTEVKAGSARLLDVAEGLRRYAAKHRDLTLSLSVKDPLLEENNGDYQVKRGRVRRDEYTGTLQPMDIAELSRMVMTDGDAGHPYMNMMLD
ncbi:MAG: sterol carrier protein domain-containing protein [Clostridia bacterium]|nr:sterol carrier protein domain-containing protein [Clostridia bacterium]